MTQFPTKVRHIFVSNHISGKSLRIHNIGIYLLLKAILVPKAHKDRKESKVLPDQKALKALPDRQDRKAPKDRRGPKARRVLRDHKGRQAPGD
jgi:hypothetical protein